MGQALTPLPIGTWPMFCLLLEGPQESQSLQVLRLSVQLLVLYVRIDVTSEVNEHLPLN